MAEFRCTPMEMDVAERFRRTGRDDHRNTIRTMVADEPSSYPCRHCLSYGQLGATMLLGSMDLASPVGIYGGASPIFVHAEACARFGIANVIAPTLSGASLVSVRCYDRDDQCIYDLGVVCPGADVEIPLQAGLRDRRTAFINVHSARPGCWLCRVDRLG